MTEHESGSSRVVGELADLTGRSDLEIKLMLGAAAGSVVAAGVVAAAIRTLRTLIDLGTPPPHRTARSH